MKKILTEIYNPNLHALYFTYKKRMYVFSGWWVLDWITGEKDYNTIDEFVNDPVFDGKTLVEIIPYISEAWYDYFS